MRGSHHRGFSLVEVVLAVGIFGGSVAILLALLPGLGGRATASSDSLVAQRLPEAVRIELRRLAARDGFEVLASRIPVSTSSPLPPGFALVASRDGSRLHARDDPPPGGGGSVPAEEQYFLIELWRFPHAPLAWDPAGAVLPAMVRVSWPHRVPGLGTEIAPANRTHLAFSVSILR